MEGPPSMGLHFPAQTHSLPRSGRSGAPRGELPAQDIGPEVQEDGALAVQGVQENECGFWPGLYAADGAFDPHS